MKSNTNLTIHKVFYLIILLHSLIYRLFLVFQLEQTLPLWLYVRNMITGLFYDNILVVTVVIIMLCLERLLTLSEKYTKTRYLIIGIILVLFNVTNYYISGYFHDGLATFNILLEYLSEYEALISTGVGLFNFTPVVIMIFPLFLWFIKNKKSENIKFNHFLIKVFILIAIVISLSFTARCLFETEKIIYPDFAQYHHQNFTQIQQNTTQSTNNSYSTRTSRANAGSGNRFCRHNHRSFRSN